MDLSLGCVERDFWNVNRFDFGFCRARDLEFILNLFYVV